MILRVFSYVPSADGSKNSVQLGPSGATRHFLEANVGQALSDCCRTLQSVARACVSSGSDLRQNPQPPLISGAFRPRPSYSRLVMTDEMPKLSSLHCRQPKTVRHGYEEYR
jgi:hypothetical protein